MSQDFNYYLLLVHLADPHYYCVLRYQNSNFQCNVLDRVLDRNFRINSLIVKFSSRKKFNMGPLVNQLIDVYRYERREFSISHPKVEIVIDI
jgi:hypothetical protein